jgi:hypothetical protein
MVLDEEDSSSDKRSTRSTSLKVVSDVDIMHNDTGSHKEPSPVNTNDGDAEHERMQIQAGSSGATEMCTSNLLHGR